MGDPLLLPPDSLQVIRQVYSITMSYQNSQPQTIVIEQQPQDSSVVISIVCTILGLFCYCVWISGFYFMKSENPTARTMGYVQLALLGLVVCLFCCSFVIAIVWTLFVVVLGW